MNRYLGICENPTQVLRLQFFGPVWPFPGICAMIVFTAGSLKVFFFLFSFKSVTSFEHHQILYAHVSHQNIVIYVFIVRRLRLECHRLGRWFSFCCVCTSQIITVMLNRTEPYVPEGGAYLPEREPFIVPVEPERTEEYEDYGADEPGREHPPHARWRRALPRGLRPWTWARAGQPSWGRCWEYHLQAQ